MMWPVARKCAEGVASAYNTTLDEVRSRSQHRSICEARWAVMRCLRDMGASLPTIGCVVNRHHTTVLHGLRRGQ